MLNNIFYRAFSLSLAGCFVPISVAAAANINSSNSTSLDTNQMYFGTQGTSGAISGSFTASSTAATNPPTVPPVHCEGAWHNGQSYTKWSACDFYGMSYRERTDRFKTEVFDMFDGNKCEVEDGTYRVVQEDTTCLMNCVGTWDNPAWGAWSACSGGLGGVKTSTRTLTYTITQPERNGGAACPATHGQTRIESQQTTAGCEPVACAGSFDNPPWGAWSACVDGKKTRTRTLTYSISRHPANGGAACPYSNGFRKTETEQTAEGCAPVNCQGSFDNPPWGEWSACVDGKKTRSRTLTYNISQNAENGGAACPHPNGLAKAESEQSSDGCTPVCYECPITIVSGEYKDDYHPDEIPYWEHGFLKNSYGSVSPEKWGKHTISGIYTIDDSWHPEVYVMQFHAEPEGATENVLYINVENSPLAPARFTGGNGRWSALRKSAEHVWQAIKSGGKLIITPAPKVEEDVCFMNDLSWQSTNYDGTINICGTTLGRYAKVGEDVTINTRMTNYCKIANSQGNITVDKGRVTSGHAKAICTSEGKWVIKDFSPTASCSCRAP